MSDTIDIKSIDDLIIETRRKFRDLVAANPDLFALFGGFDNPRIEHTIGVKAAFGTIGVPQGIDTSTTQGLMRGVDLTLLDKNASFREVEAIAVRAVKENAATVCVYPQHVATVWAVTGGRPAPIAVVGFPSVAKADLYQCFITQMPEIAAIQRGAKEIDMVLPQNFKDGKPDYVAHYDYISGIVARRTKSRSRSFWKPPISPMRKKSKLA